MLQGIISLLKILPAIVRGIKRIAAAIRLFAMKMREKRQDKAFEKAKNEKNVDDLSKEIGKLLE